MEGFYVVFDRENVQVGFAATTCGGNFVYQNLIRRPIRKRMFPCDIFWKMAHILSQGTLFVCND